MFLNLLVGSGIIKIVKILLRNKNGWAPFKTEWLSNSTDSQTLMVIFAVEDSALNHFLSGDWMTAFVMKVVKDHLDRNKIPNETFAKLSYTAPVDVIRSRSDFDVITLFSKQAHCFECKSGPISQGVAEDVMKKATEISGVLEKFAPDIEAFSFYVVYDRDMVSDEAMTRMFFASGVRPIRTDQIREMIFDMM
jgi:hypothetical protein